MSEPEFAEFIFEDFVEKLFALPPQSPYTFQLELSGSETDINSMMGFMLQKGSQLLFKKVVSEMNENEILKLKQYFHSIGADVNYNLRGYTDSGLPIIDINFKKLDPSYYPLNDKHLENIL